MPQQTQAAVDAIRMEPLGKFAQNGVVAGQGGCDEKLAQKRNFREFHSARDISQTRHVRSDLTVRKCCEPSFGVVSLTPNFPEKMSDHRSKRNTDSVTGGTLSFLGMPTEKTGFLACKNFDIRVSLPHILRSFS
jgi:hypothetical protein